MDNIFAVNLKNLRIEKGLNQTELAEKLFINKSMISSYEKGTRMPSLDVLMQLTFIFNVSIYYSMIMQPHTLTENLLQNCNSFSI